MTNVDAIAQADFLCERCAGQCVFSPETGGLTCQSCGTSHRIPIDENADPSVEQHYHPDLPHTEQPEFSNDRPYQCQTCGGEVIFPGHSISETCPYCAGALVERQISESYPALGLIPFKVTDSDAAVETLKWVSKRWAAPNDLTQAIMNGSMSGIYVPFWTFDSKEAVDYMVYYRVKSGKKTYHRKHKGFMSTHFDDLLMPASPHVTPLIRDGILHEFDPARLRPFDAAYLAGFAAERHHQSVRKGLEDNAPDKDLLLRNRIKKHSGKSRIYDVSYKTDTTGIKYRRILLPVWILNYGYDGNGMRIVTCGMQGRTFGERPFSPLKLFALALGASSVAAAVGFLWGVAQLP